MIKTIFRLQDDSLLPYKQPSIKVFSIQLRSAVLSASNGTGGNGWDNPVDDDDPDPGNWNI